MRGLGADQCLCFVTLTGDQELLELSVSATVKVKDIKYSLLQQRIEWHCYIKQEYT